MTVTAKGNVLYGGLYYKAGEPIEIADEDIPLIKNHPLLNFSMTETLSAEPKNLSGLPPLEEPTNGRKKK